MAWNKPLPSLDEEIAPFWQAMKRHEFVLCRCKTCGAWYFPAAYCRYHDNEPFFGNMEWATASGRGKVFVFSIVNRAFHPGFRRDIPYTYALIALDEGPSIGSQIIECKPEEVRIGMPVEVVFEDITEEFTLPKFRPIRSASPA